MPESPESNVGPEKMRVGLDREEILVIIQALRSTGNIQLAQRLEASLRKSRRRKSHREPPGPWAV